MKKKNPCLARCLIENALETLVDKYQFLNRYRLNFHFFFHSHLPANPS